MDRARGEVDLQALHHNRRLIRGGRRAAQRGLQARDEAHACRTAW